MKYKALLTLLIFLSFTLSLLAQYQVGHQSFAFTDTERNNRNVWGEVYYPADTAGDDVALSGGQFPLVVFGHGFVMAWSEYEVWWEELVAQGYVVAFPRTEGNISPSHANFGQDLAFIVDAYMAENSNVNSAFYQHFTEKNAIIGHSMGGGCSYLAVGDYGANVETMVSLAAANTNPSSIAAAGNINVPVLTIAGEDDCVVQNGGAPIDIYNGLTGTNYRAYVEILGATHCNFGIASFFSNCTNAEFCSGSISKAEQHNQMFLSTVPWLDYMLKGDCNAWATFKNHLTTSTAHTYQEAGALDLPTINMAASDNLCSNSSATLTADIMGNYCDVEWSVDGAVVATDVISFVATIPGLYTVSATNADGMIATESMNLSGYGLLYFDDFEEGWGNWNWGGSDSRRSIFDANYANSGDYCIRLRDNTNQSKMTTDAFDLSSYDEIRIKFSYLARSMDNENEDFWLQMANDGPFETIEEWNRGDEFNNNWRKTGDVIIPGPFTDNVKFRFRCDASGPYDWIYIDDVRIFGCGGNTAARLAIDEVVVNQPIEDKTKEPKAELKDKSSLGKLFDTKSRVYPNPTESLIHMDYELMENTDVKISIINVSGQVVYEEIKSQSKGVQKLSLDISTYKDGYYFLILEINGGTIIEKFIKN